MAKSKGRDPKSLTHLGVSAPRPTKAVLAEYRPAGIEEALLEIPI